MTIQEYKFEPTDELKTFANWFSENYEHLSDVRYPSSQNNYCIDYVFGLTNTEGEKVPAYFRVVGMYGKIEANKMLMYKNPNMSKEFVSFMVYWCVIFFELRELRVQFTYSEVDTKCFNYCFASEDFFNIEKLIIGFRDTVLNSIGLVSSPRLEALISYSNEKRSERNKTLIDEIKK